MRGRSVTLALILFGAALAAIGPIFVHPAPENLTRILIVTAFGAIVLGFGLGRLPLGRE